VGRSRPRSLLNDVARVRHTFTIRNNHSLRARTPRKCKRGSTFPRVTRFMVEPFHASPRKCKRGSTFPRVTRFMVEPFHASPRKCKRGSTFPRVTRFMVEPFHASPRKCKRGSTFPRVTRCVIKPSFACYDLLAFLHGFAIRTLHIVSGFRRACLNRRPFPSQAWLLACSCFGGRGHFPYPWNVTQSSCDLLLMTRRAVRQYSADSCVWCSEPTFTRMRPRFKVCENNP